MRMIIDRDRLQLNDESKLTVTVSEFKGNNHFVSIDNVYRDPEYVRELALSLDFTSSMRNPYPGVKAQIWLSTAPILALAHAIDKKYRPGRVPDPKGPVTAFRPLGFAITNMPAADINPLAVQAHIDDAASLAGLVYLNFPHQCRGGTSFWRHREHDLIRLPSDEKMLEMISVWGGDVDRAKKSRADLEEVFQVGLLLQNFDKFPSGYMIEDNDTWELLAIAEMKWNRLVLFDGGVFHSGYYDEGWFGTTRETERLTQNIFPYT